MRKIKASLIILAVLASSFTVSAQVNSVSKTIEKSLAFPSPVQWQLKSEDVSVSLTGLAWGPANSPEMMAKAREPHTNEKPATFSDRSYVIALGFQARRPRLVEMYTRSGHQGPRGRYGGALGSHVFRLVQAAYDIHFSRVNTT
jgi:hypothetical protein